MQRPGYSSLTSLLLAKKLLGFLLCKLYSDLSKIILPCHNVPVCDSDVRIRSKRAAISGPLMKCVSCHLHGSYGIRGQMLAQLCSNSSPSVCTDLLYQDIKNSILYCVKFFSWSLIMQLVQLILTSPSPKSNPSPKSQFQGLGLSLKS